MSGRPAGPGPEGIGHEWTGIVLAGGRSRRFGGVEKTRLPIGGRTLLQRAVDALAPVTRRCLVVGGDVPGAVERLPDRHPGAGPLGGILTALDAVTTSHVLVLAADLPFIPGSLLNRLQHAGAGVDVAFVQDPDGRVPLCLTVRRTCASRLHDAWRAGARRVRDLADVGTSAIVSVDAATARGALWNVNDPLTYARALEMAEHDCPAC